MNHNEFLKTERTILIFGAGINQLELIKAANDLDIVSVVIDPAENPPGKEIANYYYQVGGKDYIKTKKIATKHKVDGIVTGQMENPLRLMAKLADELGYIFNSPKVVETSLNKGLMKEAFVKNNVPCAKGKLFSKNEAITKESISSLSFPLIIKPVDAFSSRGVLKVNDFGELIAAEKASRSFSSNSSIIVEEFLNGKEYSVESITFKGETTVIQVTEKFITPYPHTVEMAHLQPARISEPERQAIELYVKKAINAIGIDNSASHAEVMLTKEGPKMIEIGARLGGDFIASYLTKASTGISMDRAAIQIALGVKPDLNRSKDSFAIIKYFKFKAGKVVKEIGSFDELEQIDGLIFYHIFLKKDELIKELTHSAERDACVIIQERNYSELMRKVSKAEKIIKSKILFSKN